MVETIREWRRRGVPYGWNWADVQHDLKTQGGLKDLMIDPTRMKPGLCAGFFKGQFFSLTWGYNNYASVSMEAKNAHLAEELAAGYAKVLEYEPFAKYTQGKGGVVTFEWRLNNPGAPLMRLRRRKDVSDLTVF